MTFDEMLQLDEKEQYKLYEELKNKRSLAKKVNFSSLYGASPSKLQKTLKCSKKEAQLLWTTYWTRNKAVKWLAKDVLTKEIDGQMWLFNSVSKIWYSLRHEKDIFSTLNQGTGVFCFDIFVFFVRKSGIKISLQMHDEILFNLTPESKENVLEKLNKAIEDTNNYLKLNVPLGIDPQFALRYADCH